MIFHFNRLRYVCLNTFQMQPFYLLVYLYMNIVMMMPRDLPQVDQVHLELQGSCVPAQP